MKKIGNKGIGLLIKWFKMDLQNNMVNGVVILKRSIMVVFFVLIASGCVTRNYDSNMDLGKSQLNEENYLEAHEAFELAYKEAKTPKSRELMDLSGLLASGMKKYDEQDFESAKKILKKQPHIKQNTGKVNKWFQRRRKCTRYQTRPR